MIFAKQNFKWAFLETASLSSDPVAKKGMQQKLAYAQLQLSQQAKQN